MYCIVLPDGKIISIEADNVEWHEDSQTVRFLREGIPVARINMNNVAGWVDYSRFGVYPSKVEDQ